MKMRPEASTCTWCGKTLQAPDTAWVVKAKTIVDQSEREGEFVPFELAKSGRTVTGFFVTSNSLTKREGVDVIFMTCGQECTLALKAAVRGEADNLGLVIS